MFGTSPCGRFQFVALVLAALLGATPAWAVRIVVDNVDSPGFTVLSGTWATSNNTGQWGTNYRSIATSSTPTGQVEWRPTILDAGSYEVAVWYYSSGSTRPNNATYTVNYNGGSANVVVNQTINGGMWVVLGTYNFALGTGGSVSLTNQAQTGKTIAADAVRFLARGIEFRGFWADVFHIAMQNAAQVDQMISLAVQGRYNAIVPEVLAFHDNRVGSHGAYWRSNIVARTSFVTPTFDPLAYMVQQAHANGLEIHPWLVAFRVTDVWPPAGNATVAAHPEWMMVPYASRGTLAKVGTYYEFDPGSPDVQDYLMSIVQELVTDYEIDGIHWDYIRYTSTGAGYPSDLNYAGSTLARFQDITGRTDVPLSTGDAQWDDFRRRTVTEVVRRARAEIPAIRTNPQQPIRYSAALVTWYPANTNFHLTRPYYETFSDWEYWAGKGYLDATVPMAYFDEDGSYPATYRSWVDNSVTWRYGRHTYIGPGIYMNSFANSVIQLQYARDAGADGFCTYSYNTTNDLAVTWSDWYSYVATNFFTQTAVPPSMPWRDPTRATEGTLYGRVTDLTTGLPIDDATVTITGVDTAQTDGNGFYILTRAPAVAGGTAYSVTASNSHDLTIDPVTKTGTVYAGDVSVLDFELGGCQLNADCDDGVYCNGAETCDAAHVCQPGTPVNCDDAVACTADSCNEMTNSCDHVANNALCDNGQFCDGAETCNVTLDCQPGAAACGSGTWCNESVDICVAYGNGDFNGDADVDLADLAGFQECFGQPAAGGCEPGDMAGTDGMIDLNDYIPFEAALGGP